MNFKNKDKKIVIVLNILLVFTLIVVVVPLLMLGHYNYPTADDWAYGKDFHDVITSGGNVFAAIKAAVNVAIRSRISWEPRFMITFLSGINPGAWSNVHFYRIVVWEVIITLIATWLFFFAKVTIDREKKNRAYLLPITIPFIMIAILCCPFPVEGFYWHGGAMIYTFPFALSLLQMGTLLSLLLAEHKKSRDVILIIIASVLSVAIGGGNYATSLSQCVLLGLALLYLLIARRFHDAKRLCIPFVALLVSFALCIFAPGNTARLNGNFGGTTNGILWTIGMSLWRTLTNIYSWTLPIKMWLLLLMVIPFLWLVVKNLDYEFKLPGVVTFFSYGVYATQITATMYVDGNTGGGRMADILYFAYLVWMLLNLFYWIGWIERKIRNNKVGTFLDKTTGKTLNLCVWYSVWGLLLVAALYTSELKNLTSYQAYAALKSGAAERYAEQWEARLEILNDPSVEECYFEPIPREYGNMCYYCDFEDGSWVNPTCAGYYNKKCVELAAFPQEE
jgi:hypothetical protein